jgi:hypothetical protein
MTETTEVAPADTGEAGGKRTPLILGAIALAAVVAGVVGYFVVLPMFDVDDPVSFTRSISSPNGNSPSALPSPTDSSSPSASAPQNFSGVVGRDPFKPLVSEQNASAAPAAGSAGGGSGGTVNSGSGTTTVVPAAPVSMQLLSVESGAKPSVMVRVDTAIHVAIAGETISGVIKVQTIDVPNKRASFVYGERTFILAEQGSITF